MSNDVIALLNASGQENVVWDKDKKLYRLGGKKKEDIKNFSFGTNALELSYAKSILSSQLSKYFLTNDDIENIEKWMSGMPPVPEMPFDMETRIGRVQELCSPDDFKTIISAISKRCEISYSYKTRNLSDEKKATSIPWKIEYSSFDGRWWIILFDKNRGSTIKARLKNISNVTAGRPHGIDDKVIQQAIDKLYAPKPASLVVAKEREAYERCFMLFSNEVIVSSEELSDSYRISFRYIEKDAANIIRKLLYLGPMVRLVGPLPLQKQLERTLTSILEKQEPNPNWFRHGSEGKT